jgi:hypothetical protein
MGVFLFVVVFFQMVLLGLVVEKSGASLEQDLEVSLGPAHGGGDATPMS